eukprot:350844-Chlamydomonas_euryale.AAC.6
MRERGHSHADVSAASFCHMIACTLALAFTDATASNLASIPKPLRILSPSPPHFRIALPSTLARTRGRARKCQCVQGGGHGQARPRNQPPLSAVLSQYPTHSWSALLPPTSPLKPPPHVPHADCGRVRARVGDRHREERDQGGRAGRARRHPWLPGGSGVARCGRKHAHPGAYTRCGRTRRPPPPTHTHTHTHHICSPHLFPTPVLMPPARLSTRFEA